jgi:hypothetical protein
MVLPLLSDEERQRRLPVLVEEFKANNFETNLNALPQPTYPATLQGVDLSNKRMAQIAFHPIVKSVVCGTVFGDSSFGIQSKYVNARMQNRHSTRQREWFFWKWFVALAELNNGQSSVTLQNPDGYQIDSNRKEGEDFVGKLHINSRVDRRLTEMLPLLKPNGFKQFQRSWLNHMNNYFLMTLWFDDGSLYGDNQGVFCVESYRREQLEVFMQYMEKVWKVSLVLREASETEEVKKVRIAAGNPEPLRLHFKNVAEFEKFVLIIAPIVPVPSMLYKL